MHTRRQTLLELLGLVGVLEHEGVQVAMAPDLELGLRRARLLVLLYPGRFANIQISMYSTNSSSRALWPHISQVSFSSITGFEMDVQEASLRRQISMKVLMSLISRGIVGDGLGFDLGEVCPCDCRWSTSLSLTLSTLNSQCEILRI